MSLFFHRLLPAASLLAATTILSAQQPDSTQLPRVVITATRVDAPLGVELGAVTVLQGDALRRAGVRDVADALRLVPGAAVVRSGGPGAQTSLFLRGGESDYVRVLVDGVPMNDPGGAIDLANLTLENVDRIEVVRGPASVLYGTDAVTGVVQIFTRNASSRGSADAGVRAGRYGERDWDGTLGGGTSRVNGTLAAARTATDGILPFNNNYRNDVVSARLLLAPAEGTRATTSARIIDDDYHYPTDGSGNVVDHNARRADRRTALAFDVEQRLGTRVRLATSLSALEGRGRTLDPPDGPADTSGLYAYQSIGSVRRRTADARVHVSLAPTAILTAGAEWMLEAQRNTDSSNYDVSRTHFSEDRSNRAAYAQLLEQRGPVVLSLGARYDDNRVFGSFRTGRAALAVHAWRGGTLRGSLGTAFKAPTFYETFSTAFSIGNPSLAPERSRSWEVGAEHTVVPGGLTFSASWFDQDFRDLIQYTFESPTLPNYFNVAVASARGLELGASAPIVTGVRAVASATLLRTRVDDSGFDTGPGATFVQGQRLLRRPGASGALSVAATRWSRASVDATVAYTGNRDDRDFSTFPANPVTLPAYTRVDLGGEYRVIVESAQGTGVTLQAHVQNLLGTGYQEIFNFPAPGRVFSVGVRVGGRR